MLSKPRISGAFLFMAMIKQIQILGLLLVVALISGVYASQSAKTIPEATDLKALGELAGKNRLPIMLMVSRDHCPYCVLLKNDVLNPMMISGDYIDRVVMAELIIDLGGSITDFDGKTVSPKDVSSRYNASLTPTLLFLDSKGREIHKRMIGVNTIEMYGYYVDESIDAAAQVVKNQ
jgi:thioredoxin-related protein